MKRQLNAALALFVILSSAIATAGGTVITQPIGQQRITGTCAAGSSIRAIAANGTVTCETDDTGGTYTAGDGLTLTGSDFDVLTGTGITITGDAVTANLAGASCSGGSFMSALGATGTGTCTATGLTGLATNQMLKAGSSTTIAAAWPADDGTTWGVTSKFTITEATGSYRTFGTATVDGVSTLTGLVTGTAGFTTGNNYTTTGTGDVVSADDVTAGDDITATDTFFGAYLSLNTSGQAWLFSTRYGANSPGRNIWVGGGGQNNVGVFADPNLGGQNLSFGADALLASTTGYRNIAIGDLAMTSVTNAHDNVAIGHSAMRDMTGGPGGGSFSGVDNIAIGTSALRSNTNGEQNIAIGNSALLTLTNNKDNTAIGLNALKNTTGSGNTAIGTNAQIATTTGVENIAIGVEAMLSSTTGSTNLAIGNSALRRVTTGSFNIGIGNYAAPFVTTGSGTTAIGYLALGAVTGNDNTGVGGFAGNNVTSGTKNTFVGAETGLGITTGSYNTIVGGFVSGLSTSLANNVILADGQGNKVFQAVGTTLAVSIPGGLSIGDNAADPHALLGTLNANATAGSNGEILTIVSGVPKWAAASGGLSGLTTNRITKATSSTTVGDAAIYENNGAVEMGDTSNTAISNNLDALTIQQTGTGHTTNGLALIKLNETGTYTGATSTATISYGAKLTGNVTCSDCTAGNAKVHASKILYVDSVGDMVGDNFTYPIAIQTHRGDNYFNTDDASGSWFATGLYVNPTYAVVTSKVQAAFAGLAEVDGSTDWDIGTNWGSHDGNLHLLSNGGTLYLNDTVNQPIDIGAGGTSADVTIRQDLVVVGASDLRGLVSNSTGALVFADDVTIGVSTSSTIAFTNGPAGVNKYEGKHLEWTDEWMYTGYANNNALVGGGIFSTAASGTGASSGPATGVSGRPGLVQATTGTTSTGYAVMQSAPTAIDFDEGVWTFEWAGQIPTLSTSSEEFHAIIGFADNALNTNQVDGCFFAYDRANTLGTLNAGNADKWEARVNAASGGAGVLLDGTSQNGAGGAGAITTVNSPVTAATWTRLKIVATTALCLFYIDGALVTTQTANIPTASTGVVFRIMKTVGSVARTMITDQTRVAADLTTARSP